MLLPPPLLQIRRIVSTVLIGGIFFAACSNLQWNRQQEEQITRDHPDVLASFLVELPEPLPKGAQLALEWMDPFSIYDLDPEYTFMDTLDDRHYRLDYPAKKGQTLQYRYVAIDTDNLVELDVRGTPLLSRFFYITEHSQIRDVILGFAGTMKSDIPVGSIEGIVKHRENGLPASGLIVSSAGISSTTNMNGEFKLADIQTGIQNISIFSPDGQVEPLQQQAVIEENIITPVEVSLSTRELINVSFLVSVPRNTPQEASLRIFGNLSQLGDTFAGLFGGSNMVQNLAPVLSRQSNSTFLGVIQVPADTELRYIYSIGDSFWNRELDGNSKYVERRIFVGKEDMEIKDRIESWNTVNLDPIDFLFKPPTSTQNTDAIQIQFNVYGWMEPMNMWPLGDGTYKFTMFSPINFSTPVDYRFCRSHMCGMIDRETQSLIQTSFVSGDKDISFQSSGMDWAGWIPVHEPTVVTTESTNARYSGFNTIIELTDSYRPGWMPYIPAALDAISGLNANTLIIPVTQTFRSGNPVWLGNVPGRNPSIAEIRDISLMAKKRGLQVYLMASTQYSTDLQDFWYSMSSNPVAWSEWFSSIMDFYQSTAILAESVQADGLILGDDSISSVIGKNDINSSLKTTYPDDSYSIWNDIVAKTKISFNGRTFLALNFDDYISLDNTYIESVDGIYILNLGRISDSESGIQTYSNEIARKLDDILEPKLVETGKLVWIGLDFPSVKSAYTGCIELSGICHIPSVLNFPSPTQPELETSLEQQTYLYNASLPEENRRAWVTGIASRRYSIPGNSQDQSSSIRGKPAADVVWYWFSTMTGIPTQ